MQHHHSTEQPWSTPLYTVSNRCSNALKVTLCVTAMMNMQIKCVCRLCRPLHASADISPGNSSSNAEPGAAAPSATAAAPGSIQSAAAVAADIAAGVAAASAAGPATLDNTAPARSSDLDQPEASPRLDSSLPDHTAITLDNAAAARSDEASVHTGFESLLPQTRASWQQLMQALHTGAGDGSALLDQLFTSLYNDLADGESLTVTIGGDGSNNSSTSPGRYTSRKSGSDSSSLDRRTGSSNSSSSADAAATTQKMIQLYPWLMAAVVLVMGWIAVAVRAGTVSRKGM